MQQPLQYDLMRLNITELTQLIRQRTGWVVKASVPKERMAAFLYGQDQPTAEDLADTTKTRHTLQVFIEKNWTLFGSQLPCKGENRGRCTIYPCPEGRHVDCFLAAGPHIV
jgi:hypothetical protein